MTPNLSTRFPSLVWRKVLLCLEPESLATILPSQPHLLRLAQRERHRLLRPFAFSYESDRRTDITRLQWLQKPQPSIGIRQITSGTDYNLSPVRDVNLQDPIDSLFRPRGLIILHSNPAEINHVVSSLAVPLRVRALVLRMCSVDYQGIMSGGFPLRSLSFSLCTFRPLAGPSDYIDYPHLQQDPLPQLSSYTHRIHFCETPSKLVYRYERDMEQISAAAIQLMLKQRPAPGHRVLTFHNIRYSALNMGCTNAVMWMIQRFICESPNLGAPTPEPGVPSEPVALIKRLRSRQPQSMTIVVTGKEIHVDSLISRITYAFTKEGRRSMDLWQKRDRIWSTRRLFRHPDPYHPALSIQFFREDQASLFIYAPFHPYQSGVQQWDGGNLSLELERKNWKALEFLDSVTNPSKTPEQWADEGPW